MDSIAKSTGTKKLNASLNPLFTPFFRIVSLPKILFIKVLFLGTGMSSAAFAISLPIPSFFAKNGPNIGMLIKAEPNNPSKPPPGKFLKKVITCFLKFNTLFFKYLNIALIGVFKIRLNVILNAAAPNLPTKPKILRIPSVNVNPIPPSIIKSFICYFK